MQQEGRAHTNFQVPARDLAVVVLDQKASGTSPHPAIGKSVNPRIVQPQRA
jgi:hypothetical protein